MSMEEDIIKNIMGEHGWIIHCPYCAAAYGYPADNKNPFMEIVCLHCNHVFTYDRKNKLAIRLACENDVILLD